MYLTLFRVAARKVNEPNHDTCVWTPNRILRQSRLIWGWAGPIGATWGYLCQLEFLGIQNELGLGCGYCRGVFALESFLWNPCHGSFAMECLLS